MSPTANSAADVLRYLAALAPSRRTTISALDVVARPQDFVWIGSYPMHTQLNTSQSEAPAEWLDRSRQQRMVDAWTQNDIDPGMSLARFKEPASIRADGLDRLARTDALDPNAESLRMGSGWVFGRRREGAAVTSILFPIVSRRIRLTEKGGSDRVQPRWRSDHAFHPLVAPHLTESRRNRVIELGIDIAGIRAAIEPLGWASPSEVDPATNPVSREADVAQQLRLNDEVLFISAGSAVYIARSDAPTTVAGGLERWAREDLRHTAFAHVYGTDSSGGAGGADATAVDADSGAGREAGREVDGESGDVAATFPTNQRQREAVQLARTRPVSVVSGPPGTGKTHLVAAAAVDAVAHGQSVLIVTQSDHAAESVCEILDRFPSPPHLRFGRAEHRQRVAAQLASGRSQAPMERLLTQAVEAEEAARRRRDEVYAIVETALAAQQTFEAGFERRGMIGVLTADAPAALSMDAADDERIDALRRRIREADGPISRWRAQRAERALRRAVDAPASADLTAIERGIEAARNDRAIERTIGSGGVAIGAFWDELEAADAQWRAAAATLIDLRRRSMGRRGRRRSQSSVAALGSVLRAGTARRTELLSEVEDDNFLDLLPLWIGTLDELENTLPVIPALFDLVILDEASQIEQSRAAGALCRSERIMVVGDPKQLRHVSFTGDDAMETALDQHGIVDPVRRRLLDIRRNSLFDVAAAAAPVVWLNEHYRSVPHLIDFSTRHFYDGELELMTRHPATEGVDAIDEIAVDGRRVDGVNHAEIAVIRDLIADLAYTEGTGSIGVVTPFRKQADAIVEMMLDRYSLAQIRHFGLRAGTVHSFQGSERDTMIISLAVGPDDLRRSLRFIQEPGLLNVMVTRARRRIVLLHSFDPADLPHGLLREYFRFVDDPPVHVNDPSPATRWVGELARAVQAPGIRVSTAYPVAGWALDMVLTSETETIGVECTVHPDGPAAHIDRHLALRRAGWSLTDAFQSRWLLRTEEAALELIRQVQPSA